MLSAIEQEILKKIMKRCEVEPTHNISMEKLQTYYTHQGNFTMCVVSHNRDIITAGVTKRNPKDIYQLSVGEKRSFTEALNNLFVRNALYG